MVFESIPVFNHMHEHESLRYSRIKRAKTWRKIYNKFYKFNHHKLNMQWDEDFFNPKEVNLRNCWHDQFYDIQASTQPQYNLAFYFKIKPLQNIKPASKEKNQG